LRRFRGFRYIKAPEGDTIIAMGALAPRKIRFRRLRRFRGFRYIKAPKGDTFIAMVA
jgi:hypothetical protein